MVIPNRPLFIFHPPVETTPIYFPLKFSRVLWNLITFHLAVIASNLVQWILRNTTYKPKSAKKTCSGHISGTSWPIPEIFRVILWDNNPFHLVVVASNSVHKLLRNIGGVGLGPPFLRMSKNVILHLPIFLPLNDTLKNHQSVGNIEDRPLYRVQRWTQQNIDLSQCYGSNTFGGRYGTRKITQRCIKNRPRAKIHNKLSYF